MTRQGYTAEALLAERIGLDPQAVGADAIARALHARMSALGLHDRDAYLQRLSGSEDEQQELIEEVVIPESWFFRDERPFAALRGYVAGYRDGVSTASAPPLRVLSVPCACGEEPYSIAITLLDLDLAPGRFQIDAVDVSARHLAMAERGVFRANSFRGTDLAFRDRYFRLGAHAQEFTLDSFVRATVRFTRGNLLDPHLLSGQPPYDLIFCRNVLIYLDSAARRRALTTLDRLLGPAGLLFVGHADRLAIDDPRFEPHGEIASFSLRRKTAPVPRVAAVPPSRPLGGRHDGQAATAPPKVVQTTPRALFPESSTTLLDEAAALADRGRHEEAAARCELALRRCGPSARAFFLLGLIRQAGGQLAEAEAYLKKTIYLDPSHDEALFALALIAQRRGDHDASAGFRRRAERARAKANKGSS